ESAHTIRGTNRVGF
ncbi:unnamed protein product, partial [Rotaria sp. Silwood2]